MFAHASKSVRVREPVGPSTAQFVSRAWMRTPASLTGSWGRFAQSGSVSMTEWPKFKTARGLAETDFPVSRDVILEIARKHNIGRKMGRERIFSPQDAQQLYEVLPCPSGSSAAKNHRTGSSVGPSADFALKRVLELVTAEPQKKSALSGSPKSLNNQSMVVALPSRSRRLP